MFRIPALLTTALVGAALVPATASADVELGGAISLRLVDSHHATVKFASDELPVGADGKLDARIVMAPGKRPAALQEGRHARRGHALRVARDVQEQVPRRTSGTRSG